LNLTAKITAIEPQTRRKNRVNVYLDGRYAFSLSNIVAERHSLAVGLDLTQDDIGELLEEESYYKALDTAFNFLSYRPRSEREVRLNLKKKRFSSEVADRVIQRLRDLGLIDDLAFASFWVDNRQSCRPRGTAAIRAELRSKGVNNDVIAEVAADVDEEENAYRAAIKQASRLRGLDYNTFRQRLGGYLVRRGFSYDAAAKVTRRLWEEGSTDSEPEC